MEHAGQYGRTQPVRYDYLDILRILAAFGIVVIHLSPLQSLEVSSAAWRAANALISPFRASVVLFFMISGALFLDPHREISTRRLFGKTLARMLTSFFFWSAVYALAHCILYGKGKWTFLNQLLRGHYHMWYIFTAASLYLITPILRSVTASRRTTEYLLGVGFLLTFVCARVIGFVELLEPLHADVVASMRSFYLQLNPYHSLYFVFYFVLGHYLHAYPPERRLARLALPAFVLFSLITGTLCGWHSAVLGETSAYFGDLASLNVLGMAVSLFVAARAYVRDAMPERAKRGIRRLSEDTYGIYLVHAFIIERLSLSPNPDSGPLALVAFTLLACALVFALSALISDLLHQIPGLRRYIV